VSFRRRLGQLYIKNSKSVKLTGAVHFLFVIGYSLQYRVLLNELNNFPNEVRRPQGFVYVMFNLVEVETISQVGDYYGEGSIKIVTF